MTEMHSNRDEATIASFADEWSHHPQSNLSEQELKDLFEGYFGIFPWASLPLGSVGFDMGCGSGRWARFAATHVGHLHCIDAAEGALAVARRNLASQSNVSFHHATTQTVSLPPGGCDFGYSLGVLHHIPDTQMALNDCVRLLKPGAPFLVYLYYRFDNRPWWFRALWSASDLLRKGISHMPAKVKNLACDLIAYAAYWPLSRFSTVLEKLGFNVAAVPLSFYRHSSLRTLRTDSRDRFGTPLEQRFTRSQIDAMMKNAGLESIRFSEAEPFWCAVGTKAPNSQPVARGI